MADTTATTTATGAGAGAGAGTASAAAGALSPSFLAASHAKAAASAGFKQAVNAVTAHGLNEASVCREKAVASNHIYSTKLKVEGTATSQKASGRCWLFAACNVMRLAMMDKYNLDTSFELSQPYLFFWDKVERANHFLEKIIETRAEPVDARIVQHFLSSDLMSDGGQWDMIVNIVNKHGMVPKSAYPESHSSSASRMMNGFLRAKLREFARELRGMNDKGETLEALRARKEEMVQTVHKVVMVHLGEPPSKFEWSFYNKDKEFKCFSDLTPQSFYADHIPLDVNDYVSLVNDPRNDYSKLLSVEHLGNVVGGFGVRYINCDSDTLRNVARSILKDGKPVWFGCDVGKFYNRKAGVMDLDYYDYEGTAGTTPKMNKADRLVYGQSLMTHAMVFTGVDERGDKVMKWRVENSWGTENGSKGYYSMTDAWFNEYMYQVVADKKYVDATLLEVLKQEPKMLPAWDPMGSLAMTDESRL